MKRKVGKMGEYDFGKLCATAGITANPSLEDEKGWDFFVEYPTQLVASSSAIHDLGYEVKIQVKATDGRSGRKSIKLDNLLNMATSKLPAFYVFFEYDKKESPQQMYLVHVDDELITNTLKRVHEARQSIPRIALNKQSMSVKFGDDHRLQRVGAEELQTKIRSYVGKSASEYTAKKVKLLETVGYEGGALEIDINIEGEESFKDFLDASIGIEKDFSAKRIEVRERRFNIPCIEPLQLQENARLSFEPTEPTSRGSILCRNERTGEEYRFDAEYYSPLYHPSIPNEHYKYRIKSTFFEFILSHSDRRISFHFSPFEVGKFDLRELQRSIRVLKVLDEPDNSISVTATIQPLKSFDFSLGGQLLNFEGADLIDAVENASKVVEIFDLPVDISLTLESLMRNAESNRKFLSSYRADASKFTLSFQANKQKDVSVVSKGKTITYFPSLFTEVGDYVFVSIHRYDGVYKAHNKERCEVVGVEFSPIHKKIFHRTDKSVKEYVKKKINCLADELPNDCLVVVDG